MSSTCSTCAPTERKRISRRAILKGAGAVGTVAVATPGFGTLAFASNEEYAEGMAASIRAGVRAVDAMNAVDGKPAPSSGYMFCLGDQPLVSAAEYRAIATAFAEAAASSNRSIVAPYHRGRQGNPIVFSTAFADDILQISGSRGCRPLLERYRSSVVRVEIATDAVLRDVDTEGDLIAITSR